MTDKKELEIRDLNTGDVFTVARMLMKVVSENKDSIKKLIKSKSGDKNKKELTEAEKEEMGIDLAFLVLQNCLEFAEQDLKNWFSDLIGKDPEEFDETPFDTIPNIINQLTEKDDVHSFFTAVLQLYKKMNKSRNSLTGK
jgi:hypothetical protein